MQCSLFISSNSIFQPQQEPIRIVYKLFHKVLAELQFKGYSQQLFEETGDVHGDVFDNIFLNIRKGFRKVPVVQKLKNALV